MSDKNNFNIPANALKRLYGHPSSHIDATRFVLNHIVATKPFAYFEVYWVKEDTFGRALGGECGMYDRGIHCLVGEQEFRGPHRVRVWLSALVHFCWLSDLRTERVFMEPRIDNAL